LGIVPNPQSPIPNPHIYFYYNIKFYLLFINFFILYKKNYKTILKIFKNNLTYFFYLNTIIKF